MLNTKLQSDSRSRMPFARKVPFGDQQLIGMFELFDGLPPGDARAALSGIARRRLREFFPQETASVGIVELMNGLCVEVDQTDLFGAEFYVGHCNEAALISALCATIPPAARIVDVGANFGLYALHAAHASGKDSRAVAFEPAPKAFNLLVGNINRNQLAPQISARHLAVSNAGGTATFHVAKDESFSGLRDTGRSPVASTITIPQASLDDDHEIAALGPVDFLKIDTEGGEAQVLMGAKELIRRSPKLVLMMEYSVKNLTPDQTKAIRSLAGEFIGEGLRMWSIDQSDDVAPITSIASLPATFNGTLIMAAKGAVWVESFLSAIGAASGAHNDLNAPVTAAAQALLVQLANSGVNQSALQSQLASKSASLDLLNDKIARLNGHISELNKTLSGTVEQRRSEAAQLEQKFEAERRELRAQLGHKDASLDLLNDKIARLNGHISELNKTVSGAGEQRRSEAAQLEQKFEAERRELRAQVSHKDASLELLNQKVDRLRGHIATLNETVVRAATEREALEARIAVERIASEEVRHGLERAVNEANDLLETRRLMIRQLQQQVALLRLGRSTTK